VINFKPIRITRAEVEIISDQPACKPAAASARRISLRHRDAVNDGYNFMVYGQLRKQQELSGDRSGFFCLWVSIRPAMHSPRTTFRVSWPDRVRIRDGNLFSRCVSNLRGNTQLPRVWATAHNCGIPSANDRLPQTLRFPDGRVHQSLPATNQVRGRLLDPVVRYGYSVACSMISRWIPTSLLSFPTVRASYRWPVRAAPPAYLSGVNSTTGKAQPVNAIWTDPKQPCYGRDLTVEQRILLTFSGPQPLGLLALPSITQEPTEQLWTWVGVMWLGHSGNGRTYLPKWGGVVGGWCILSRAYQPLYGPQSARGQALASIHTYINRRNTRLGHKRREGYRG